MTARTISTSKGAAPSRTMASVTAESFGPRTIARAASTVIPSSRAPPMDSITSPGSSPAFSAGDPGIGATTTSRQSAASVVQLDVAPLASTVPIVAPMPSNSPEIERRLSLNSSLVRYSEYGSPSAPIMPLIAPSTSALRSTSPPAYRSVTSRYVSQNGWNSVTSSAGVPGVSAAWRPSDQPETN